MTAQARPLPAWSPSRSMQRFLSISSITLVAIAALTIYLMPLGYMTTTAFKTLPQIQDSFVHLLPSSPVTLEYQGKDYPLYQVPTGTGIRPMALFKKLRSSDGQGGVTYQSTFIDPNDPQAAPLVTDLNWFKLEPVYRMDPTLANFPASWKQVNLGLLFRNTLFVAVLGTLGTLLSSTCVAYGFSRFRIPGINILFIILVSTIILPTQITLIPQYIFFRSIGWGGTLWPLIIPHFFSNAYNVFLLRQYFKSIPKDLDEAAMIDGANPLQTLLYVILPQSIPALTAVGLFHFFWAWNDFFAPLIYLQGSPHLYTISIGMTQFANIFNSQPGYAMAAAMMTIALPVVIFFLAQRAFMQGIVITGVEK
jgi:multiple sugar transport system permease protein